MTNATVTEEDREAAHALLIEMFGGDGGVNVFLRDRIARIAADARAEENRACEAIARGTRCDPGCCWRKPIADAIAKRRGGK